MTYRREPFDPHGKENFTDGGRQQGSTANITVVDKPTQQARPTTAFGSGNSKVQPQHQDWTSPVHASNADGQPVTVSFGTGPKEDETLLKDGHADRRERFDKKGRIKQHDHYGDGKNSTWPDNATDRGKYTGEGS